MPTKFEQYSNNAVTTLASGINNSVTSLTVVSATGFPTDGNFRILIGSELLLVTAVSGAVFTVVRGVEVSAIDAHSSGDPVSLIVSQESFVRLAADHVPFFGLETIPGPLNSLTDTTGVAIDSTDFTWTNQGTATVTDFAGAMLFEPPTGTGGNLRILSKAEPSTPYTIYAAVSMNISLGSGDTHGGLCWRESGTGKIKTIALNTAPATPSELSVSNYTNPTSFSSWDIQNEWYWNPYLTWLYLANDGTDISCGISSNGLVFIEYFSQPKATFFTTAPDEVGFYFNVNDANIAPSMMINHWSEQ